MFVQKTKMAVLTVANKMVLNIKISLNQYDNCLKKIKITCVGLT